MKVDKTGMKYRNTLISEAVFISNATYHKTYPMTVGNTAKKRTAPHPLQVSDVTSAINDGERNGIRPRHPKRNA